MKKLFTCTLIFCVLLLSGCSIQTNFSQTTEEESHNKVVTKEQLAVETIISENENIEEKLNGLENEMQKALENSYKENTENTEENNIQ